MIMPLALAVLHHQAISNNMQYWLLYYSVVPILQSQYHGCWCPGDDRSQGITNHDIDYVELE